MTKRENNLIPVVMIRHAQSQWNKENRFTGWADPPLTEAGIAEAALAGDLLRQQGWQFDFAYSSRLQRASHTLSILLDNLNTPDLPTAEEWRLNERHYGVLQGKNKAEMADHVGEQQVMRWRRGYYDKPQAQARDNKNHPANNSRYSDVATELLPGVENLHDTRQRVMQFWQAQATPRILQGQRLLISAHGNSLRALIMGLSQMSIEAVEKFEIPTATPIVYYFNKRGEPLTWGYINDRHIVNKL